MLQTPEELQITFSKYISKLSELHPDETARKICETVISRLKIQARNNPELAVIVRDLQRQCAEAKAKSRKRMLFVFAGLAALLCVLGVMAFIAISHEQADSQEIKKELTKARQFWDAGNKKEAVAIYKTLIIDRQRTNWIDKSERPIVFQRAIEHEFNQGNLSSAKQLISEAKTKSIVLSFSDAKISELVAATEKHGEALPIPNALLPEKLRKDEGDGVHPITPDSGQTGSPNNKNSAGPVNLRAVTIDQFRQVVSVGSAWNRQDFFARFGPPSNMVDLGSWTYISFQCKDGIVRVKCDKPTLANYNQVIVYGVDRQGAYSP